MATKRKTTRSTRTSKPKASAKASGVSPAVQNLINNHSDPIPQATPASQAAPMGVPPIMGVPMPKAPRMYDTSSGTVLGNLFRGLIKGTGQLDAPGARPVLPNLPEGFDQNALLQEMSRVGSTGDIYSSLNKANPDLAKQFYDQAVAASQYDAKAKMYNDLRGAQDAVLSGQASLGQLGTTLKGYWQRQPFLGKAAGAGLALGNIGGLVDNDKFGGQLGGLALGGLGSKALMSAGAMSNPGAAALLTMAGGELGALFDKLRAKREGQRRQISQQQQARR